MEIQQYAYKYRLYPTKKQEEVFQKHFGCSRFIYNWGLALNERYYERFKKGLSKTRLSKQLTKLKKQEKYKWLNEVNSSSLLHSLNNLDDAFKNFFRGINHGKKDGFPNFKNRFSKKSYQFHQSYVLYFDTDSPMQGYIKPPKFDTIFRGDEKHQLVKMATHRKPKHFPNFIKKHLESADLTKNPDLQTATATVTISQEPSGEYYASILFKWRTKGSRYAFDAEDKYIGIDLGLKDFVITSEGDKYNYSDSLKINERHRERVERKLSRKRTRNDEWKDSNRYKKLKQRKAKAQRSVMRQREQEQYEIALDIIRKYKPKVIGIETLKVKNMLKNKRLSKAISDKGWYAFKSNLKKKCEERGIELVEIDAFFASSQTCSNCGHKNSKVKDLSVRQWECDNCGESHDRDINASINIREEAKKIYQKDI